MRVTDPVYAKDLALAAVGIAYIFEPLVRAEIRDRTLRWLMPAASMEEPGLFLYFPKRSLLESRASGLEAAAPHFRQS